MPTVQQLLDDIRVRLPLSTATFTDGRVIAWMNDAVRPVWRYMASTEVYEFTATTNPLYTMPSDWRIDMTKSVQVSDTTDVTSTSLYETYSFCGPDDDLSGSQYFDGLGMLGIYPTPTTNGYGVKVTYEASFTVLTTDTLITTPNINEDYHDVLKYYALSNIALSGNAPDVELGNNYRRDYNDMVKKIRMDYYKRKARNPRTQISYRDGYWSG